MEAEYAALSEVSREVVYLKRLLTHMGFKKYMTPLIRVFCDNQSAIELSKNAVFHKRSKHININFQFTRELVDKKEIEIHYLQTDSMLTNILTKSLTKCKHDRCVESEFYYLLIEILSIEGMQEICEVYRKDL